LTHPIHSAHSFSITKYTENNKEVFKAHSAHSFSTTKYTGNNIRKGTALEGLGRITTAHVQDQVRNILKLFVTITIINNYIFLNFLLFSTLS